jgi:transposase
MNTKIKNTTKQPKANETAMDQVEVIRLGVDLHAAKAVVSAQFDGCPPQPVQKLDTERYVAWVERLQQNHPKAQIVSCYEAGPCGYWVHRGLEKLGVKNYVVAPVALNGRRKTDRRDAGTLREQLERYVRGHKKAFSVVRVPTPEQERDRALVRHRETLGRELARCAQRGRSLCLLQGLRVRGSWWGPRRWPELKATLPEWLRELLTDFQAQAQLLHGQIGAVQKKIVALAKASKVLAPYGVGELTQLMLELETRGLERFNNRREVASFMGLCASEYSTGERRCEGAIDKQGNRRARRLLVEAVWRLLLWQPQYPPLQRLVAAKGQRTRKRAVVAVARRLAIDLWRLKTGRTTPEKVGLRFGPPPQEEPAAA